MGRSEPQARKLVVGLGNPGRRYRDTRHNAGWMALDRLADRTGAGPEVGRCNGLLAGGKGLWFFKPLTYMNRCGPAVARLLDETAIDPRDLLVVVDDLALPLGRVRLRPSGSSGGHRGLGSLIGALGMEDFPRLRMGIGPCPEGVDARDFVLSAFAPDEWDLVESMAGTAAEAAVCWAEEGIEAAMNRFNRRDEEPHGAQ